MNKNYNNYTLLARKKCEFYEKMLPALPCLRYTGLCGCQKLWEVFAVDSLAESIKTPAEKAQKNTSIKDSEEAAKQALVLPFFNDLGYDVSDTQEICPQQEVSSYGKKYKADHVIKQDDKPVIVIECKQLGAGLNTDDRHQLAFYLLNLQQTEHVHPSFAI